MSDYPMIEELAIPIQTDNDSGIEGCYWTDVNKAISTTWGRPAVAQFGRYFGVQTCPIINGKMAGYPWDIEAVLVRMASGKKTGSQLHWD